MRFYKGYIPFTDWTIHCYELGSNFPFQFSWAKAKKVYLNFFDLYFGEVPNLCAK